MNEISAVDWKREMDDARALMQERFPDLACLRCRKDKFFLRIWPDQSLVPGLADASNNRVVELICENCGFQEKHVVNLLAPKSATLDKPNV
jgi:predicted nucleic-acid-binding Zn-ribbon protein